MPNPTLQDIVAHAKAYGFIYHSSEIYDGLQAVYDYGPCGVALKRNIQEFWWKSMTQLNQNIVGVDAAIFMHPRIWEASGHVEGFNDLLIDNKDSKKRYRADVLIEDYAQHLRTQGKDQDAKQILDKMHSSINKRDFNGLYQLILDSGIICPIAKNANWTSVRQFNLMFSTQAGAVEEEAKRIYLRPETAQGIFVNFLNVQKTSRMRVPFGIAQIGKAFRNEIIARQFTFRMLEFEQMEMQFFIPPGTDDEWFTYWQTNRHQWHKALGLPDDTLQIQPHEQLAHYAKAAVDITYKFPFGFKEIEGIHARGDFDLSRHQAYTGKKLQYFDPIRNESYLPHVIETSIGLDRCILALLCAKLRIEEDRTYLKLPPALAPTQAAILPLTKKDGLPEIAQRILQNLQTEFRIDYDLGGSIGKRYARQDLVGTPYCITVDHQTHEDDTVTIRNRDNMQQERLPVSQIACYLTTHASIRSLLQEFSALSSS